MPDELSETDKELKQELKQGKSLAEQMVEHMLIMGASTCTIPVGDYEVIVRPATKPAEPAYKTAYKVGQKVFLPAAVLGTMMPNPPDTAKGEVVFVGDKDGRFIVEVRLTPNVTVEIWEQWMLEIIGIVVAEAKIGFPEEFGQGKRLAG